MLSPQVLHHPRVSSQHPHESFHRDGTSSEQVTPTQAAPPQQQYPWSSSFRLADPFSPDRPSAAFKGGRSASAGVPPSISGGVDVKRLVFDNLSALVWSTKHNRLLLENGSDAPEVASTRASLYMSKDAAEVFCEDRRVVMERLLPRDIASVTMQDSNHRNGNESSSQRWTVAIHGHDRIASDDTGDTAGHATRLLVRSLPNGVTIHRAHHQDTTAPPLDRAKRHHQTRTPTWSTVLFICPSKAVATRIHDALEALRIQYIQAVPHGHLPEAREVEHAVVLQHRARECIARFGLRPYGLASAPSAHDTEHPRAVAMLTHSPLPGSTAHRKQNHQPSQHRHSTGSTRGAASSQQQRRDLSLMTSIVRSPQHYSYDASPAADYEVLLGSSESEQEADPAESSSNSDDDAGFSSDDDNDDGEHSNVVRRVFQEPFVPMRSHMQELLNGGTWPPQPPASLTVGTDRMEPKHDIGTTKTPPPPPLQTGPGGHAERMQQAARDVEPSHLEAPSPSRQKAEYEELLGSPRPQSPTVSARPSSAASQSNLALSRITEKQEPTATERRTHDLIERLRTEILRAHAQRQERQNAAPQHEPTMMVPATTGHGMVPGGEGSHEPYDRRASVANLKGAGGEASPTSPKDGSAVRDADDDDSDASLEFHEEALPPQSLPAQQSSTPRKSLPPPKSIGSRRVSLPISSADRDASSVVPAPPLRRATISTRSPPRGVPAEVRDQRTRQQEDAQILEAALGGGPSEERRTPPAATARRSPVLASSRFQVTGIQDPWKIDRDEEHRSPPARRASNTTPIMKTDRKPSVHIVTPPQRDATPARSSSALRGASQESPRTSPSHASGRRCRWCKNVAPESHDERCSLRKIKCKKCGSVLLLKERNAHTCTQTL